MLIYGDTDLKLMEFTNISFQSDHDDSKSMLGYVFILNGGAIYWKNFKQHTVVDSTFEVKYIAIFDTAKEAIWLWKFINELGVASSLDGPILLDYDSIAAIA